VQFGVERHMQVVAHNLVWHSQPGAWVFQGVDDKPADRDTLLARMGDHIRTVVSRYKGKINGWDVVNEAIDEDGSLRKSPWQVGIGDDYVAKPSNSRSRPIPTPSCTTTISISRSRQSVPA
jgi:endo-1,4-beta-xylanase